MFEIGRDPFADPADARHENLVDDAQMADLAGAVDTAVSDDAPVEGVTQDVIVEDEAVQDVTTEDSAAEGSTGEVATAAEAAVRSRPTSNAASTR
jgi:uncharacterized low-complexity protein